MLGDTLRSWKCKRVTRSVLAADVFAYKLQQDVRRMTGIDVPTVLFTDSRCLFDRIKRMSNISEKLLLIYISALRQCYARGELSNIGHISSQYNLADPLTKRTKSKLMEDVMTQGRLRHPVNQCIIHRKGTWNTRDVPQKQLGERENGEWQEVGHTSVMGHIPSRCRG